VVLRRIAGIDGPAIVQETLGVVLALARLTVASAPEVVAAKGILKQISKNKVQGPMLQLLFSAIFAHFRRKNKL
jgi:hypothetical protein